MRIFRYWNPALRKPGLGAATDHGNVDLSRVLGGREASLEGLCSVASEKRLTVMELLTGTTALDPIPSSFEQLNMIPDPTKPYLLQPVVADEVWAAGVTYERSCHARESESAVRDVYERVYDAKRPEIFFKATPSRCVGPNVAVGIRGDSQWSVPEPELALLVDASLNIVGFTLGNDMSSRDIEGENPLYLPQAKVFTACCSLGPAILLADGVAAEFSISCRILREDKEVFHGITDTGQMHRTFENLVRCLGLHNTLPAMTVLLTGTGIVPPDSFTLRDADVVEISSPAIGFLRNPVKRLL